MAAECLCSGRRSAGLRSGLSAQEAGWQTGAIAVDIAEWIADRYDLTHRLGNWAAHGVEPALEGVTWEIASWRPAPDQHTIAEIVAHLAYHTELVVKRLRGGRLGIPARR